MALVHRSRSRIGSIVRVGVVVAVALGLASTTSSAAEEDPFRPGLPKYERFPLESSWVSPRASTLNYATAMRQWIRPPALYAVGYNAKSDTERDTSCRRLFPYSQITQFRAYIHLRSTAGASEPYGIVGPFKVRSLAFGSVPVEADIQLLQVRDEDNLPVGMTASQRGVTFCAGEGPHAGPGEEEQVAESAEVTGKLGVVVTGLRVDGVDVELRDLCRTVRPGDVSLRSNESYAVGAEIGEPVDEHGEMGTEEWVMRTPKFTMANGGLLRGTVDVPAFVGCRTSSGEDLSKLLTASVSGKDNPVTMRSEGLKVDQVGGGSRPPLPALPIPDVEATG